MIQYFWEMRISSINIIQCREYSIEERLNILKGFYGEIEKLRLEDDFESIEDIFDEIIKTGQDNGEFRSDIPAEIITEMFHSLFQSASFSSLPLKYQENIRYKLNLVLSGIILK